MCRFSPDPAQPFPLSTARWLWVQDFADATSLLPGVTTFVAFLRAINVGGTGKLPMAELCALCRKAGFSQVVAYIQSGNVIFRSSEGSESVRRILQSALREKMAKATGVFVMTVAELAELVAANPFPQEAGNQVQVFILPAKPVPVELEPPGGESVVFGDRAIYVHYPQGMGTSKLKLSASKEGTARNLNTLRKVLELARHQAQLPAQDGPQE